MTAYYNELDEYAAAWLRNLISAGLIAPGDVDTRSIVDVRPDDLIGYTQCHFFAGIGGWSYAARLAGWADDRPLWTGSCPCQPYSVAGKGEGQADARHLWPEFFRLIGARRPDVVMGEQVAAAVGKHWLDGVCADLEGVGYAVGAAVVPACAVGASHRRDRVWFVADAEGQRGRGRSALEARRPPEFRGPSAGLGGQPWHVSGPGCPSLSISDVLRPSYGVPARVGKLRAFGNAIVPQVAAEVIGAYMDAMSDRDLRLTGIFA